MRDICIVSSYVDSQIRVKVEIGIGAITKDEIYTHFVRTCKHQHVSQHTCLRTYTNITTAQINDWLSVS